MSKEYQMGRVSLTQPIPLNDGTTTSAQELRKVLAQQQSMARAPFNRTAVPVEEKAKTKEDIVCENIQEIQDEIGNYIECAEEHERDARNYREHAEIKQEMLDTLLEKYGEEYAVWKMKQGEDNE